MNIGSSRLPHAWKTGTKVSINQVPWYQERLMATQRNRLQLKPAQVECSRQVTSKDGGVFELNIEELEDRIAPRKPPTR
jgi:hypothetical protein